MEENVWNLTNVGVLVAIPELSARNQNTGGDEDKLF